MPFMGSIRARRYRKTNFLKKFDQQTFKKKFDQKMFNFFSPTNRTVIANISPMKKSKNFYALKIKLFTVAGPILKEGYVT